MSMLHTPSYNLGRSAGIVMKGAGFQKPKQAEDIPGIEAIMENAEPIALFFPSSWIEGFVSAWDYPDAAFIPGQQDFAGK